MIKRKKQIGLSRDLIIHPGETIAEYLKMNNMSQKELAIRCGVSEKHISTVISGLRNITVDFAVKLEYAFGIDADFWIKLQANYDKELIEYEEEHNITDEELNVFKKLDYFKSEFKKRGLIDSNLSEDEELLSFRHILNVSNLLYIPKLLYKNNDVSDPYIFFAQNKYNELIKNK